jgi:parallel beta-helix repeat protein
MLKRIEPFKFINLIYPVKRNNIMIIITKLSFAIALMTFLFFSMTTISYQQLPFFDFEEEGVDCINYQAAENTITIDCDHASFGDVIRTIHDPSILEKLEQDGEYLLKANLRVADGVTFEMTSDEDGLQYLKIAGANGIIVHGKILIDGVKITSWNASSNDVIQQDRNGTIHRGYVQFAASEGSQIINSEFAYLGDVQPGRRGFDLLGEGDGEPSHDIAIRNSKFHDMWFAFYSNGAYNIVVDGNEYYNNIKYALDPHTVTHDMNITNNYLHHNPIGVICSDGCFNILIEGNVIDHNTDYGIFFSRNTHDSIARNNQIYNVSTGIMVSESPNNQIYNNTIEEATSQGIRLFNPILPDDGFTEGNLVYNNTIIDSQNGIVATRSQDNIVQNTTFSDIKSSQYRLSGDSSIIILGQQFDNALISQDGSETTVRQRS